MNVAEFIAELQKLDQSLPVVTWDDYHNEFTLAHIQETHGLDLCNGAVDRWWVEGEADNPLARRLVWID